MQTITTKPVQSVASSVNTRLRRAGRWTLLAEGVDEQVRAQRRD
ncbi:MAG: hypothetical protein R3C05_23480 [Pirellulaceae bacterium]